MPWQRLLCSMALPPSAWLCLCLCSCSCWASWPLHQHAAGPAKPANKIHTFHAHTDNQNNDDDDDEDNNFFAFLLALARLLGLCISMPLVLQRLRIKHTNLACTVIIVIVMIS